MEHPGPSIAVVTGEGGSGGALSLAVCDRILICENAIFSVIAPEGAAAILKRPDVEEIARDLKLTGRDLVRYGLADGIVPEPPGGAHTDPDLAIKLVGEAVGSALDELAALPGEARLTARRERWRNAGNAFLIG
jgi:acetyl-CoA carboxylase alpha subunit